MLSLIQKIILFPNAIPKLNFLKGIHLITQPFKNIFKVEKILKGTYPGFDSTTFTFSEKSYYGRESLLEV
jgi:hypothetical protein